MSDDNVVTFSGVTYLDTPPDRILQEAIGKMAGVVVIGLNKDGSEVFKSSYADGPEVLWLLERMKKRLLETVDD